MSASQQTQFDYDAEMFRYHGRLMAALDVRIADHVLDIGCGARETTRDAARAAQRGAVLGVDVSKARLDVARRLATDAGLTNVSFPCADVQAYAFPDAEFDVGVGRFVTMFFTDPTAALANIRRALRPGARLCSWYGSPAISRSGLRCSEACSGVIWRHRLDSKRSRLPSRARLKRS